MAITTLDQLIAAASQRVTYCKTASRTSVAAIPFSVFDQAGNPGAGTLAIGNTANGVVPTDATAGYPVINAFGGSNTGYISSIQFGSSVACRMILLDCLFSAGAYAYNASTTLASQPSYSSRVLGGTDYSNTEIWIEAVTAFTGNQSIAVTYTNQDGTTGRTTGTIATGVAPIVGRMLQLPLQAGDTGVQKIESVTSTVATVGTFNVHVMRRLWMGRVRIANDGDAHDILKTGMPQIFADSALRLIIQADSTATGIPELVLEIVNG